jgi:hypothetical protein
MGVHLIKTLLSNGLWLGVGLRTDVNMTCVNV